SGKTWIPLAPAFRRFQSTPATGVLRTMAFSTAAAVDTWLAAPQSETPAERLHREVEEWLAANRTGESVAQQLGSRTPVAERLGHLPSTLPFTVVATTSEAAELASGRRQTIRFRAFGTDSASGPIVLDRELALAELVGQRVTLSYIPATVDDHRAVLLFGGLGMVPAYLVDVRPVLKIAGRDAAVGEPMPLALAHRLEIELSGPWGAETLEQTLVSGSYHALAVGGPRFEARLDDGEDPADTEQLAARLLSSVAYRYGAEWDAAQDELGGLYDVTVATALPSIAFVANSVRVTTLAGIPEGIEWQGVTLDAALRAVDPIARSGVAAEAVDFLRFDALEGSALERRIFEELFLAKAVSADHGLGLARASGIPVERIDAGNVAVALALVEHSAAVEAEVARWAAAGSVVTIPRRELTVDAWRGSVFRAEIEASGATGYFLSGGLAGGATTEDPASWLLQFLADALAAPYAGEPNLDPLGAVSIAKLPGGDEQDGTVDELLPIPLAVIVRDGQGRPVQGAAITFRTGRAGGRFEPEGGLAPGAIVTATSDRNGVASVPLRLGTDTRLDPVYRNRSEGDPYPQRVLAHVVEAEVATSNGPLLLAEPIVAFGFPGDPHEIRRADGSPASTLYEATGSWIDTLPVEVVDRYGNPIANALLIATIENVLVGTECSNPLEDPLPPALFERELCDVPFPLLGDCGPSLEELRAHGAAATELELRTRGRFAPLGVLSPNTMATTFTVVVSSGDLAPLRTGYEAEYTQPIPGGPCRGYAPNLDVVSQFLVNAEGTNAQAALPGTDYATPLELRFRTYWPNNWPRDFACDGSDEIDFPPASLDGSWLDVELVGPVPFEVTSGGSVSPEIQRPDSIVETTETVGALAAFDGLWIDGLVPADRKDVCLAKVAHLLHLSKEVNGVWSVRPVMEPVPNAPIVLDDTSALRQELVLSYQIEPAEYRAMAVQVRLYADDELVTGIVATSRSDRGTVSIQRGVQFDPTRRWTMELVLNAGTTAELASERVELPVAQRLFSELDRSLFLSQDVDLLNERVCERPASFHFHTGYDATVSLSLFSLLRQADGGYERDGGEVRILSGEALAEGSYDQEISTSTMPPGEYEWELTGVSVTDGHTEVETGFVRFERVVRDSLAIGHTLVDGVDVFDGHLTLAREEFSIPARGIDLAFSRNYSSSNLDAPGVLGPGWSHNWESFLFVTPCGEVVLVGGDGSGMRFVGDGDGGFRPLSGFHGTLRASSEDSSFDFFAKGGRRFHYVFDSDNRWRLSFVEDLNGNQVALTYELARLTESGETRQRLAAVTDGAGRSLVFRYENRSFQQYSGELLVEVESPGGVFARFD
ncbi:MAG: DUF6531 domain-containing protein, partial [Candidatus Binatia bacterium]